MILNWGWTSAEWFDPESGELTRIELDMSTDESKIDPQAKAKKLLLELIEEKNKAAITTSAISAPAAAFGKQLARDHWSYIESILIAHGVSDEHRAIAQKHYIDAMQHGFKHGIEYAQAQR